MPIYLQEIAAIDRGGKEAYLELLRSRWVPRAEKSRGMRLLWIGSTVGSTARWPETMAVWELRDWDHWAEVCARMYVDDVDDPELASFWKDATKLRSRSMSRTLVAAPFSPTLDRLLAEDVAGTVFVFGSFRVKRGRMTAFFEDLERFAAARRGRKLVGAYEVGFEARSAYAIWAHRSLAELAEYESEHAGRSFGGHVETWSERWGFAAPGSPLWPKDYRTDVRIW